MTASLTYIYYSVQICVPLITEKNIRLYFLTIIGVLLIFGKKNSTQSSEQKRELRRLHLLFYQSKSCYGEVCGGSIRRHGGLCDTWATIATIAGTAKRWNRSTWRSCTTWEPSQLWRWLHRMHLFHCIKCFVKYVSGSSFCSLILQDDWDWWRDSASNWSICRYRTTGIFHNDTLPFMLIMHLA